jgi:predicted SAM-dependent methyltransferase
MAEFIKIRAAEYRSADLFMTGCDLVLNLEKIDLSDESVDAFVASHVLEHVNDSKALKELYRCLREGGVALIMTPIIEGWAETYENTAITSQHDRNLHFGQFDHVRYYGADLRDRILEAGFQLEEFTAPPQDCVEYGLMRGETVFLAHRRPETS